MSHTPAKRPSAAVNGKKPKPRVKRTTAVPLATMGEIRAMRESKIGMLGWLDIDTMASMLSYLVMSDVRTLASILVHLPLSVRTSPVIWAACDAAALRAMHPAKALIWVHTVAGLNDDKAFRAKLWESIVSTDASYDYPHWINGFFYRGETLLAMQQLLTGKTEPDVRFVKYCRRGEENKANWLLRALNGKKVFNSPLHSREACFDLVLRVRDTASVASFTPWPDTSRQSVNCLYMTAAEISAEKATAVVNFFMQSPSAERCAGLATAALDAKRDDDAIKIVGLSSAFDISYAVGSWMREMHDADRFVKLYPHMRLTKHFKLLIIKDQLSKDGGADSRIVDLIDNDITSVTFDDISNLGPDGIVWVIKRYGSMIKVSDANRMWLKIESGYMTPERYRTLSSFESFRETREFERIILRNWNRELYELLVGDGLVVTPELLKSVMHSMSYHGSANSERVSFMLEHIEMTPENAIKLLEIPKSIYDARPLDYERMFATNCRVVLEYVRARMGETAEIRAHCMTMLKAAPGPYAVLYQIASATGATMETDV